MSETGATARWRPMVQADLAAVVALAARAHPAHPERPDVFAERRALAPDLCLVLDHAGLVAGYLIAHPWTNAGPPALDTLLGALPEPSGAVHLHDLVIAPELRGRGLADGAIERLQARARSRWPCIRLVAVAGKEAFWARRGWRPVAAAAGEDALASYGPQAVAMVKPLPG